MTAFQRASDFVGAAKRIEDVDIPRVAAEIGVGEDEIHAVMDVEAPKSGFDSKGRPRILFEPHVFDRCLPPAKKAQARRAGLSYEKWRPGEYGPENAQYPKLERALVIDETAALKACSWGRAQILGENFKMVGYASVQDMVRDFMADEDNHLEAMVRFIKAAKIDDDLRRHAWAAFAKVYNGPKYATHGYDKKLATRFTWWSKKADTPYAPEKTKPAKKPPATIAEVFVEQAAPAVPEPELTREQVEDLQRLLRAKGYTVVGVIDGDVGKDTIAAIKQFQDVNGLPETGEFDAATRAMLPIGKPKPVSEERANATVKQVEEAAPGLVKPSLQQRFGAQIAGAATAVTGLIGGAVNYAMDNADNLGGMVDWFGNMIGYGWPLLLILGGYVIFNYLNAQKSVANAVAAYQTKDIN